MVDTKDILLKAAEDVSSGMWCKGEYFQGAAEGCIPEMVVDGDEDRLTLALASKRCAMGSLAVATKLLGGSIHDFAEAELAVNRRVPVINFNDRLPDDPFEAGQALAEVFRQTADSL